MESASEVHRRASLVTDYTINGLLRPFASFYSVGLFRYPNHPRQKRRHFELFENIIFRHFIIHFSKLSKLSSDWLKPLREALVKRAVNCLQAAR